MKFKRQLSKMLSAALAGAMMLSGVSLFPGSTEVLELTAAAASECTIDPGKTYQIIRGFGGMNHPEWQGYDLSDDNIKTAFGNDAGQLGLTILRIYCSDVQSDWSKCIPAAKKAQAYGATVFATPWNPPASMRSNGSGGPTGGKYVLNNGAEAQYAKHLNDYVKYVEGQGVNLYSISVQNEPDYSSDWTYWNPERTTNFIVNYGEAVKSGTKAKLMSPESFQYSYEGSGHGKIYYKKILENSKANQICDLFGTHFYGTIRDSMNYATVKNSGKEIWMTEVYVPNSNANSANNFPEAIEVAENIHNGLVVGNMSAYVWWYIRRSYSLIGQDDGKVTKRGAMMAQYSKWVRPGAYRIDCTEQTSGSDTLISAYQNEDGTIAVVAINKGSGNVSQSFSLKSGETIKDIDAYQTNANQNFAAVSDPTTSGSSFSYTLPGNTVTTFVVNTGATGVTPTPTEEVKPAEPDANGYYFHDTFESGTNDWTGRGAASVSSSSQAAQEGSKSLLVTDRGGTWQGAQKTLDYLTFKAGESYSFSVCGRMADGAAGTNLMLSVQYTDTDGKTAYGHIANATASSGGFVQIANTNFTLPEGSDFAIYVETEDGTDSFYIDEAIVAKAGTKIAGPSVTGDPTQSNPSGGTGRGDVNGDGVFDVFDYALAKQGILKGNAPAAADVDGNGKAEVSDLIQMAKFLHGKIKKFDTVAQTEQPTEAPTEAPTQAAKAMSMKEFTAQCQAKMANNETNESKQEQAGVQYGTIKSGTYYSTTCNREKPYNILLPAGYDESKQYPVLYVMHGYWENQNRMIIEGNGTMYTRQIIGNAIASGEAKDMIVVFPYIYSSATQKDCSAMDDANNAAYDNFINDLTKDLMPHIEKTYSVKTGKDNTAITGFSMGGRESLLIGMQRSDLFGYVGAICPAPGVTGTFNWESGKEPYLLYITAGGNDQVVYDTPKPYHENFEKNGVPHIWHYYEAGYHGDNSIHAHLYNFVRFVFQATN